MIVVFVVLMYLLIKARRHPERRGRSMWQAVPGTRQRLYRLWRYDVRTCPAQRWASCCCKSSRASYWLADSSRMALPKIGTTDGRGEIIIAGIVIGPSFLGSAFPLDFASLFPRFIEQHHHHPANSDWSLFMFAIGMGWISPKCGANSGDDRHQSHRHVRDLPLRHVAALIAYKSYVKARRSSRLRCSSVLP